MQIRCAHVTPHPKSAGENDVGRSLKWGQLFHAACNDLEKILNHT